jgi:hypothetical protein
MLVFMRFNLTLLTALCLTGFTVPALAQSNPETDMKAVMEEAATQAQPEAAETQEDPNEDFDFTLPDPTQEELAAAEEESPEKESAEKKPKGFDETEGPVSKSNTPDKPKKTTKAPDLGLNTGSTFAVNFVRTSGASFDEATLRISMPVLVNGCVKVKMVPAKVQQLGSNLSITVEKPEVRLSKEPRYSQHSCGMKASGASVDVKINRADLMENGIKQIALKSKGSGGDTYYVEATHDNLTLIPKSTQIFKPNDSVSMPDPLSYWFYPANTVVLSVSRIAGDLSPEIRQLAHNKGMVGLDDTIAGFEQPAGQNKLYFVDQSGATVAKIKEGGTTSVGQIPETQIFSGPQGEYEKQVGLDVMAHLPGLLD